jgi:leader peptidase (prepilin peptidase) / N-methyltransferase
VAWLPAIVAFPFGLALGSFMTVVTERVPAGVSVVSPRSRCPTCGAEIANKDNIPVLAWFLLRGRCRSCGSRISARYPLLELSTALLFSGAFLVYESLWVAIAVAFLLVLMPAIAAIDIQHRIIPNRLMYPALIAFPIYLTVARLFGAPVDLVRMVLGFALYGGALFAVAIVSRGMGMGDVKLAALMGLYLGRAVVPALLIAFAAGALAGVWLMVRHGTAARRWALPFAPFLAVGGIAGLLVGDAAVEWYLDELLRD